jgi:peptidoglycan/LPS O-acetylase OafA/YrhL
MNRESRRRLEGLPSFILDFVRISAALVVLIVHFINEWFPTLKHAPEKPGDFSHGAVVVFFVLSGYVIAHTTVHKNRGPIHYAKARLSRLWSVVIPALILSAICEWAVGALDTDLAALYTRGQSEIRYVISSLFLNEVWLLSSAPPINGPLWSLSFEFWYYAIFGIFFFRPKGWKGWLMVSTACLIAGPKILLMMPIWLLGLFGYKLPRPKWSPPTLWASMGIVSCLSLGVILFCPPLPFPHGQKPLFWASQFITDIVVGSLIATTFWLMPDGSKRFQGDIYFENFRHFADLTFPIYVLHYPLMILWQAVFTKQVGDLGQMTLALGTVFVSCCFLGILLGKQRKFWTEMVGLVLDRGGMLICCAFQFFHQYRSEKLR